MKKWISLLLSVLLMTAILTACKVNTDNVSGQIEIKKDDDTVATDSVVIEFELALKNDEYSDATEQYNTNILGNSKLEAEAANVVSAYMSAIEADILAGEVSEDDAKVKMNTVEKVCTSIECPVENYSTLQANVQSALNSKVAYKSGCTLFEAGNYLDAIEELGKVLEKDANYADAVSKLETARDSFVANLTQEVDKLCAEGDYSNAVIQLKEALLVLPEDVDLLAAVTTCEKQHIQAIIDNAKEAFVDHTCYSQALSIIQAGLQLYPQDVKLAEKKEYYLSFEPINLYDMPLLKGEAAKKETDTDIYGLNHTKAFWNGFSNMIFSGKTDISYHLDGKYNLMTATIYGRSPKNDYSTHSVCIYGDGRLLYEKTGIRSDAEAFDISVDVTSVDVLQIVFDRERGGITQGIGMAEMLIWKTAEGV